MENKGKGEEGGDGGGGVGTGKGTGKSMRTRLSKLPFSKLFSPKQKNLHAPSLFSEVPPVRLILHPLSNFF